LESTFDVVLLFDGSSTLGRDRFLQTLQLAKDILSPFDISVNHTNVAGAVYAHNTTISFNLREHFSDASVAAAIDAVPFLDQFPVNLSAALQIVNESIISTSRENVSVVLVVFVFNTLSADCTLCQALREQGVKIIAVGLGDQYDYGQLVSIASNPAEDFVTTISFLHISTGEGIVSGAIAQGQFYILKFSFLK